MSSFSAHLIPVLVEDQAALQAAGFTLYGVTVGSDGEPVYLGRLGGEGPKVSMWRGYHGTWGGQLFDNPDYRETSATALFEALRKALLKQAGEWFNEFRADPKPTAPTSDHNCDDYPERCPRRPSKAAARAALREYLAETVQVHEVPYFRLSPDGDCDSAPNKCGWAFTICPEDTTSYLREDLTVAWYGTEWEPDDASS